MKETTERQLGKLVFEHNKYLLEVQGHKMELPVSIMTEEAQLKELVGKEVEVLYSEPTRFVVGLVPLVPKIPHITCYIPAPDWLRNSTVITAAEKSAVAQRVADQLLKDGFINKEVHLKISGNRG